jgi:general L-amino acid transport system permease protein
MADPSIFFSRSEMLPPEPPPGSAVGPIGWLRANLFSSIGNSILTLVAIYVIWWLFSHISPWFAHAIWNADSYAQCRQIITDTWGEGAGGACLAVIRERWKQFMFGFYPAELYWRPTLAFILMFVALAPILFSQLPRKILGALPGHRLLAALGRVDLRAGRRLRGLRRRLSRLQPR